MVPAGLGEEVGRVLGPGHPRADRDREGAHVAALQPGAAALAQHVLQRGVAGGAQLERMVLGELDRGRERVRRVGAQRAGVRGPGVERVLDAARRAHPARLAQLQREREPDRRREPVRHRPFEEQLARHRVVLEPCERAAQVAIDDEPAVLVDLGQLLACSVQPRRVAREPVLERERVEVADGLALAQRDPEAHDRGRLDRLQPRRPHADLRRQLRVDARSSSRARV